jgi:hypothetical protein
MDNEVPLRVVRHLRDSSRLNAQTLRDLADGRDADGGWLKKKAGEIDQIAEALDNYLISLEERG